MTELVGAFHGQQRDFRIFFEQGKRSVKLRDGEIERQTGR